MLYSGVYHSWWPYLNGFKKLPTSYRPWVLKTATILKCFRSGCQLWLIWKYFLYLIVQSLYLSRITSITSPHLNICISEVALNYAKNVSPMSVSFGPKYHISKTSSLKNQKSWRKKKMNRNDLLRHISVEAPLATPGRGSRMVKREKRGDHDVWFIVLDVIHLLKIDFGWSYPGAASASWESQFSDFNIGFFVFVLHSVPLSIKSMHACVFFSTTYFMLCLLFCCCFDTRIYLLWSPLPVIFILLFCCGTAIFGVVVAFYKVILLTFYLVLLVHNISVIILLG